MIFQKKKIAFILHTRISADCLIQQRLTLPSSFIFKAGSMIHFVDAGRQKPRLTMLFDPSFKKQ